MKIIYAFIMLLLFGLVWGQNLEELRVLLKTGQTSEKDTKSLIDKARIEYQKSKKPICLTFEGVGYFYNAKLVANPYYKLKYFKKGKSLIEESVAKEPNNLEIRLMRYLSQEQIPSILGYNSNLKEDKDFILKNYLLTKDMGLKKFIKSHFKLK